jgi:hypothetical protein
MLQEDGIMQSLASSPVQCQAAWQSIFQGTHLYRKKDFGTAAVPVSAALVGQADHLVSGPLLPLI